MSAHSKEFTHQLITATAASGLDDLAEADHSMDALYQACRSVARPDRLGNRRICIVSPEASLTDWTWLDQYGLMAVVPITRALWSRDLVLSSPISDADGSAPALT